MKLTKVLVGLLAVSLCGAAVAVKKTRSPRVDTRTQEQLTAAELYSLFLTEVKKSTPDKKVVTDLFNLIMNKTEGMGLLPNSMKNDLRSYATGLDYSELENAWNKAFRAGKTIPVTKKTEDIIKKEEAKKEESKTTGWDNAWGEEPKWDNAASVGAWSDGILFRDKTKALAAELTYAIGKMEASPLKAAFDSYIKQAKIDRDAIS